ncbi:phosphatase PAP2 family protein [Alkalicoccus daliensis]|uniref:Undecaprenyl-diphosphatase n=1 Tax=Alkalicoccus daliensis TaxID=745820 RepID=A0A1H0CPW3_9BACI|nr:phosphatase PAP2 family protein [Alkalicoccus daliensis]SDN59888.1 undecaprenyl-diphosphatase [Alkalicoccus daliensis]
MERFVDWVVKYDLQIFHTCHQQFRCRLFDHALPKITHLGGAVFTISMLGFLFLYPNSLEARWILSALFSLVFSHLIVHVIKKRFSRPRPYERLQNVTLSSKALKDFSFPSGHSTAAFSLAVMFSIYLPLLAFLLLPAAATVAFSRMYLGLHYPTDCLIGAVIGSASSCIIAVLAAGFF